MKRPLSVTILSWVFIVAGAIAVAFHSTDLKIQHPFQYLVIWILLIRALAILFGVYMLRGRNWARWGAIFWLAFHVVISGFHSFAQLAVHVVFLAVLAYFLFTSPARDYFEHAEAANP